MSISTPSRPTYFSAWAKKLACTLFGICSFYVPLYADSSYCGLKATTEFIIPGSGYAWNGDYSDAAIWGGVRYWSIYQMHNLSMEYKNTYGNDVSHLAGDSYRYQKDGKTYNEIYTTRIGWQYAHWNYVFVYSGVINVWDLYHHDCVPGNESYKILYAPVNVSKWGGDWQVYPAFALSAANGLTKDDTQVDDIYTEGGLTRDQMLRDDVAVRYFTGIAEELVFRDMIQHGLYNTFKNNLGWTPRESYWTALFTQAALFGAAHSGQIGQATSLQAFAFGVYLGYTYQPNFDEYHIEAAIAIHSWWDMFSTYGTYNQANYFYRPQGKSTDWRSNPGSFRKASIPVVGYSLAF